MRYILDNDGNILTNEEDMLERWRLDFENLYNGGPSNEFDNDQYNIAKANKYTKEINMKEESYQVNEEINYEISFQKISNGVMHAKSKSSYGFDEIPYNVLEFPVVLETLQHLFQHIFDSGTIPSVWRKAIICPILKDPTSDKRLPMNYRGVSLLYCISKLYSSFINKRTMCYLESNGL